MKRSKKVIKLFQVNTPSEDSLSLQHGSTIDPIQASVGFSETNPQEGVRRRKQLSRSVWGQDEKKDMRKGIKTGVEWRSPEAWGSWTSGAEHSSERIGLILRHATWTS